MTRTRRFIGAGLLGLLVFGPILFQLLHLTIAQWRVEREQQRLAAERERLLRERERLTSDPVYVEGLIRSTFKLAKPTEYVIPVEPSRE